MSALFPPWTNTVAKATLFCIAFGIVNLLAFAMLWVRAPVFLGQRQVIEQPIQFDHRHHVQDDGIDCRYCHDTVERSSSAGYPPTATCMNCHAQVWNKSPLLDQVRGSYFTDRPIAWRRVHRIPQFVYFNHSIHVAKGVGCVTCHGRVDQMALMEQAAPITMGWCLDCHRDPAPNLRPREQMTSMTWQPEGDARALGEQLARDYGVHTRTSCTTCHR
jgi:hypothetical protein